MNHPTLSTEQPDTNALAVGVAPARARGTDGAMPTAAGVPFSNTGQKITDDHPTKADESSPASEAVGNGQIGFELDAEWIEFFTTGKRLIAQKTPIPYAAGESYAALIDWLSFTIRSSEGKDHEWVIRQLQGMGLIGAVEDFPGGYCGYTRKASYRDGNTNLCLIAWGGKSQGDTIYVSFPGHGCARIQDWQEVRGWLEQHQATITRLDLAYDDFEGECVSINQAVEWYQDGGFGAGGRMPRHKLLGDWMLGDQSRAGRTLEIGSREGGKLCRVYEKGKQLGDPDSRWVRVEVEWHNKSRHIPYDALRNPGKYLAGAYKCLHFLNQEQSRIRTQKKAAKVSYDYAMYNGRRLVGKLVNLALEVNVGDYAEVVEQLRREGYPARVEPYMHAVGDQPEILCDGHDTPHLTRGERL